jgi:hypothetical protein
MTIPPRPSGVAVSTAAKGSGVGARVGVAVGGATLKQSTGPREHGALGRFYSAVHLETSLFDASLSLRWVK